jgi:hypothetical protein
MYARKQRLQLCVLCVYNILKRELQPLHFLSCLFIREIPRDTNLVWLSLGVQLMQLTLMTFFTCRCEVSTKIWEFCPEQNLGHIIPHGVGLQQQALPGLQYTHDTGQGLDQGERQADRQVEIVMQAGQDSHAGRSG